MAKNRMIDTIFWEDNYSANLDPIEKLLFLYFLTNSSTSICGIYQITIKKIAVETGIDKEMVEKILTRFTRDGKIFYHNGWLCLRNFIKNQNQNSPTVIIGIKRELSEVPSDIMKMFIGYGYPMDTLSHLTKLNLKNDDSKESSPLQSLPRNSKLPQNANLTYRDVDNDGNPKPVRAEREKKSPSLVRLQNAFIEECHKQLDVRPIPHVKNLKMLKFATVFNSFSASCGKSWSSPNTFLITSEGGGAFAPPLYPTFA